jgi:hypothetical protein
MKVPVYDAVPIQGGFVSEHNVAGAWQDSPSPLWVVFVCNVPNVREVQFASFCHVFDAKIDRPRR